MRSKKLTLKRSDGAARVAGDDVDYSPTNLVIHNMSLQEIHVKRKGYTARDLKNPRKIAELQRYNADAAKLENYVNRKRNEGQRQFFYYQIAPEVGIPTQRVKDILYCIGCGEGGFTLSE